ncbi:MAG: threonine--tRNA ligase, partial [Planctomycetes bacterium]|nr:threonine--tRNA ligase [Planctomycetota bacterium]
MPVKVKLPDGSVKEYGGGVTALAVAGEISPRLASAALAARIDNELKDVTAVIGSGEHSLKIITDRDSEALEVLRHTAAHVLAQAMVNLYGKAVQYTIGPALMDDFQYGFYYDFDLPCTIVQEDLPKIEQEMKRLVEQNIPLERVELPAQQARARMTELGQSYKCQMIDDLLAERADWPISLYKQGDFLDMCRGPHLPSTGKLKAFKLLNIAGAYWRGSEKNKMLTRIYGTAFFDAKTLQEHLARVEEARKRDHRVLGRQLELFTFSDLVGPGLPLWMPKGAIIRMELEGWLRGELLKRGYKPVITPHIGRLQMWRTSGHYPYYEHGLFPTMVPSANAAGKDLIDALTDLVYSAGEETAQPVDKEKELARAAGVADRYPAGAPA